MPYGADITEGLPYSLSNPSTAKTYQQTGAAYDLSLNGLPFFIYATDESPYRRQTADYRKQQIDQSNEPGEQTLTGWWVRSQSSFHNGSGIKFYDPSAGETVAYRFADSKGVNVWEKGKVTLLNSCTQGHIITGPIAATGRPQQFARPIRWSGTNGILLLDEYDVDKIDVNGTVTNFVDYNAGVGVFPVYGICDDGTTAYWVTNVTSGGSSKLTVYKKPLTGSAASTADEVKMFDVAGVTINNAIMEFVKERIVACFDNKVYEFTGSATSLPAVLYTHPSTAHNYTSITASGTAIYISGYNGIQSTIQKFTLVTSGANAGSMPSLSQAIVAAELPVGEVVYKIYYYLGKMAIGTSKGIRIANVSDDGSITYGPLIVETSQPVYDFTARDRFIWAATGVEGEPGLIRIDLGQEIEALRFAYANDIYYPGVSGKVTTACSFAGTSNQILFTTAYSSGTNGYVYAQSSTTLMPTGYIETGRIRYATLEGKVFKIIKALIDNTDGGLIIESIDSADNSYTIGSFAQGDFTPEVNVTYPSGAQEYLSFRFTLSRNTTDSTKGPKLSGYQLKSLPAVPRQRIIQYPIACFDNEKDKYGVVVGYDGSAYARLTELEALESSGDSIRVDDFRTNESYIGLIESISFFDTTPPSGRFSGFGGIMLVTIRSL